MSNPSQSPTRKFVAVVSFYLDGENKVSVGDEIEVAPGSKTTWGGIEVKFGNLRKAQKAGWVVAAGTPEAIAAQNFAEEDPEGASDFPHLTRGNRDASTLEESDMQVATVAPRTASVRATDGQGVITDAARPSQMRGKAAAQAPAKPGPARPVGTSINQGASPRLAPRPVAAQRTAVAANRAVQEAARADRVNRVTVGSSDGGVVGRAKTPLTQETLVT